MKFKHTTSPWRRIADGAGMRSQSESGEQASTAMGLSNPYQLDIWSYGVTLYVYLGLHP